MPIGEREREDQSGLEDRERTEARIVGIIDITDVMGGGGTMVTPL